MTATLTADALRDFDELANPLRIPIGGKVYVVPPVGIRTAQQLRKAAAGDEAAAGEFADTERFYRAVLGKAFDEMLADDVPEQAVDRAAMTALADFQVGRERAAILWTLGDSPETLQAVLDATRRIAESATETEAAE